VWYLCDSGCGRLLAVQAESATEAKAIACRTVAGALATAAPWARAIADLSAAGHDLGAIAGLAVYDRSESDCARLAEALVTYIAGPVTPRAARRSKKAWSRGERDEVLRQAAPYVRRKYDLRAVCPPLGCRT
jgi:hypothetical protein